MRNEVAGSFVRRYESTAGGEVLMQVQDGLPNC